MPDTLVTEPEELGENHSQQEDNEFKANLFDAIEGAVKISLEKETETKPPSVIAPVSAPTSAILEEEEKINEGITVLMGACQQGLEHDVRSILRRYDL